jgi:tetratricopeptide (TPR) repeat protein
MKTIKKAITLTLGLVMLGGAASFAQSLADAKKAIDAEQYQKAKSMLKTLISSNAKEGDNYFYLGNTYLLTEDLDSARMVYTNGVTASPKNALNFVGLGHADLHANNATSAKTNFDKAIQLGAKNYETYLHIGRAYIDQKTPDFASSLPNLQKAEELDAKDKDAETFVALGDFYALQTGKNSDAFSAYYRAIDIDPKSTRAIVQIGRTYQQAFAFPDAETQINLAIAVDPNYGPAYRGLAENAMQWSRADVKIAEAKRTEALTNMRKYLDLTDKSFESRLRYAQFLVYANDFATLGQEVATLNAPDVNNPKTFVVIRMRGYSAVENKDFPKGVQYMNELFARTQDAGRVLGSDYLYLGKAYAGTGNDSLAVINITKAVKLDSTKVEDLADLAKKYYAAKNYGKAAEILKFVVNSNAKSPSLLTNLFTLGTSNYFAYGAAVTANKNPDKSMLVEADSAFAKVSRLAPDYESTYLFRARANNQIDRKENGENLKGFAVPFYQKYVEVVTVTKPGAAAANARNLVESYNNLGSFAALTDKEKAKEYFNKTLAIDPQNGFATQSLQQLTGAPAAPKKAPIKK